jgi:predicted Zn-dependent peptidase
MELGSMAADLFIYGYKADELRTLPERLAKVTIADVQRVATAYLDKDLYIVIVGDKAKVLPQLEALKPNGKPLPVTELDPWGEPLKGSVK